MFSPDEIDYVCSGLKPDEINSLNPLLFKCTLNRQERESLDDNELIQRKKFQSKRTRFRFKQKHPEEAQKSLERLKSLRNKKSLVDDNKE